MKKLILLIVFVFSSFSVADIMDTFEDAAKSVRDVVKAPFNGDDKMPKVETVRTVTTIEGFSDNHKKNSLLDDMIDTVRDPLGSENGSSLLTDMVDDVKDTVGIKTEQPKKKEKTSLFTNMVDEVKDTVGLKKDKPRKKEDTSLLTDMVDGAKGLIGIKEDTPEKKKSFLDDAITSVKEVAGMKKVKEDNSMFDGGIMGSVADMIELEKGESYGLPSVFGLNKKKQKKVFGSSVLGDTFLGDIKDSSTSFYKGFKTSGESTEFMSGVMYKSSKAYNGMFGIFDGSALNIFDDGDEVSIFDSITKGNDILDMFD